MQSVHHLQWANGKQAPHMPLQVAQLQSDATNEKPLRNKIAVFLKNGMHARDSKATAE